MLANTQEKAAGVWQPIYWLFAAGVPAAFMVFEIARIAIYETSRAPNVSAGAQLLFLAAFYALWIFVPRILWIEIRTRINGGHRVWFWLAAGLLVLGLALSAVHLFILTFILLVMYAPEGWGLTQLFRSFGEAWLANADIWWLAYLGSAAMITWYLQDRVNPKPDQLEVRRNNQLIWIPVDDILWIRAAGKSSEIVLPNGPALIRASLSELAKKLGRQFIRTHRSALVNTRHISAVRKQDFGSGYVVIVGKEETVPLSRRKLGTVKKQLRQAFVN